MPKLEIAKQLIQDYSFTSALDYLKHFPPSLKGYELKSLLFRFFDKYQEEQTMLSEAESYGLMNDYLDERKKWHEKPIFDRLESRQPIIMPEDPSNIPKSETLDKLCFVTACSSREDDLFVNLLVQLVESIDNCPRYRDVPICVFDVGLNNDDKHKLSKLFSKLIIRDPGFDIPKEDLNIQNTGGRFKDDNGLKSLLSRPFVSKHFPEYDNYLFVDTDMWFQHQSALDQLVFNAERTGICCVDNHCGRVYENCYYERMYEQSIIPKDMRDFLLSSKFPLVTPAIYCINNRKTNFFERWQKNYRKQIQHYGFCWGNDDATFNYTLHKNFQHYGKLSLNWNFDLCGRGLPRLKNDDQILYSTINDEMISVIHLCGCGISKHCPLLPCPISSNPFNEEQYRRGAAAYAQLDQVFSEKKIEPQNVRIFPQQRVTSLHFRTLPWRDKTSIRKKLQLSTED